MHAAATERKEKKKLEDLVEKEILMESPGKCKSREEKQILALLRTRGEREQFRFGEKVRGSSKGGGVGGLRDKEAEGGEAGGRREV